MAEGSRCAKGLNHEKTSRRPLDKDEGLTKQSKKRLMLSVSKNHWIVTRRKEPSMVDEAINNQQNWNALNNGMYHINSSHPRKQEDIGTK